MQLPRLPRVPLRFIRFLPFRKSEREAFIVTITGEILRGEPVFRNFRINPRTVFERRISRLNIGSKIQDTVVTAFRTYPDPPPIKPRTTGVSARTALAFRNSLCTRLPERR